MKDTISTINERRKVCHWNSTVLKQLGDEFGPRGVQHFLFTSLVRQLSLIANSYLNVLSDGGIKLVLDGDNDADKIVKSVVIRSADGSFRERGLSQLSGGQWRRVSMSLDFAFAEMIRRRGILRCNMVVMDEVLTHLDASGREAVGSVLRAMVEGSQRQQPSSSSSQEGSGVNNDDDMMKVKKDFQSDSEELLGGGSYETVLVILQDLAAVELEEAFDHIDVVVKDSDISTVVIDGGH
eukprot:gene109-157_t